MNSVKSLQVCPPSVNKYATLQFQKFGEIYDAGYRSGMDAVRAWREKLEQDNNPRLASIFVGQRATFGGTRYNTMGGRGGGMGGKALQRTMSVPSMGTSSGYVGMADFGGPLGGGRVGRRARGRGIYYGVRRGRGTQDMGQDSYFSKNESSSGNSSVYLKS